MALLLLVDFLKSLYLNLKMEAKYSSETLYNINVTHDVISQKTQLFSNCSNCITSISKNILQRVRNFCIYGIICLKKN
jgi:hypothetical protein